MASTASAVSSGTSPKSGLTAFLLCLFIGGLGIHRFYVGKIGTGILMLITLGGIGVWSLYDLVSIACGNFTDKQGRVLAIEKSKTAAKKVAWVVGVIFVCIFGLTIASTNMVFGKMSDVTQQELAAIRSGDIDTAYSYTSSDFQKEVSKADFRKFISQYPELSKNVSATFTDREMHDNQGDLTGTLKMSDGKEVDVVVHLIKENDDWKILGIELPNAKND